MYMVHYTYEIGNKSKELEESFRKISLNPAVMFILLCSATLHICQHAHEGYGRYLLVN